MYYEIIRVGPVATCYRQGPADILTAVLVTFELEFGTDQLDDYGVIGDDRSSALRQSLNDAFHGRVIVSQSDAAADVLVQLESKYRLAKVTLFDGPVTLHNLVRYASDVAGAWVAQQPWNKDGRVWLQRSRATDHDGTCVEFVDLGEDR